MRVLIPCLAASCALAISFGAEAQAPALAQQGLPIVLVSPVDGPVKELLRGPAGRRQPALGLGLRGDTVVAANCPARCDWDHAVPLGLPGVALGKLSKLPSHPIGAGRRATVLRHEASAAAGAHVSMGTRWLTVVVATDEASPRVLFDAATSQDDAAPEGGAQVLVTPGDKQTEIVVGRFDPALQLCGRPALLEPRMLLGEDLQLHRVKYQRLSAEARAAAPRIVASPRDPQAPLVRLSPVGASSGAAGVAAAVDNNPDTHWTEGRSGAGEGEFLVLRAPVAVPIAALNFTLPRVGGPALSPRDVWLVTDTDAFNVSFELQGSLERENTFQVTLPRTLNTRCVAVALQGAPEAPREPGDDRHVGIAELSATAVLSGSELSQWVTELGGSESVTAEAQAALVALGETALPALGERFTGLSVEAQARALDILDSHPCANVVDIYLLALGGALEERALRTLRACGAEGLPKLAAAAGNNSATAVAVAPLLIQLDPAQAVRALAPHLSSPRRDVRAALRVAIAQAVGTGKADAALSEMLSANLPRRAAIDLLRSAAGSLRRVGVAATAAVRRLIGGESSFSSRYLLLGPATELVDIHPELEQFVLKTLANDPQFGARARAAELVPASGGAIAALIRAVTDEQVRVRVAAVQSLGRSVVASAEPALIQRVLSDQWPLVRAEAVRALGGFPQSRRIDEALATSAAEDTSAHVRRPSLVALGRRSATGQVQVVRERFERDDDVHVRAAAAESLGALCDSESLGALTRSAAAASRLTSTPAERIVGRSALKALGRLNPPDLDQRLAPFSGKEVPRAAKSLARAAKRHPSPCRMNPGS